MVHFKSVLACFSLSTTQKLCNLIIQKGPQSEAFFLGGEYIIPCRFAFGLVTRMDFSIILMACFQW